MDVNVTRLVDGIDPFELSASVAERGNNAGRETWSNAKLHAFYHARDGENGFLGGRGL